MLNENALLVRRLFISYVCVPASGTPRSTTVCSTLSNTLLWKWLSWVDDWYTIHGSMWWTFLLWRVPMILVRFLSCSLLKRHIFLYLTYLCLCLVYLSKTDILASLCKYQCAHLIFSQLPTRWHHNGNPKSATMAVFIPQKLVHTTN